MMIGILLLVVIVIVVITMVMLPMSRYEEEGNKGLRSDGVFVCIVVVTDTNDDAVCDLNGDDYHDVDCYTYVVYLFHS